MIDLSIDQLLELIKDERDDLWVLLEGWSFFPNNAFVWPSPLLSRDPAVREESRFAFELRSYLIRFNKTTSSKIDSIDR